MKLKLLSLLLAASALTVACGDDDNNTGPDAANARVRVVHASPDAPNVDVLVDNAVTLSNVPYLGVSDYLEVPSGNRNLKVNAAGTATTVVDADVDLTDGSDYTVIASGLVSAIELLVLQDDNTAPAAGNVRVRADPRRAERAGGGHLRYRARSGPRGGGPGAEQRGVRRRRRLPRGASGHLQVRVTPTGSKTVVIDSGPLTLTSGQVRTADRGGRGGAIL